MAEAATASVSHIKAVCSDVGGVDAISAGPQSNTQSLRLFNGQCLDYLHCLALFIAGFTNRLEETQLCEQCRKTHFPKLFWTGEREFIQWLTDMSFKTADAKADIYRAGQMMNLR